MAGRDCDLCQIYQYDEQTGRVRTINGTKEPMRRPPGGMPLCRTRHGCPKGTPENQLAITAANYRAYEHYLECKATGNFPDDPIVKANAVIIQDVLKRAEQASNHSILKALSHVDHVQRGNLRQGTQKD